MSNTPQRRRRQNVSRSTSLLGALKSIVSAPFSWFSGPEPVDEELMNGKRKQAPASTPHERIHDTAHDNGSSRVKRIRLDSPTQQQQQQQPAAYLDPPATAFQQQPHSFNSHGNRPLSRNMSIDPPAALSRNLSSKDPTPRPFAPLPVSRDRSMPVFPQTSSSFRMRTSLTPQPSGSNFGPTIRRPDRDASEPPPLTSLMSNPVFVRAPSEAHQTTSMQPATTLGALSDSRRLARSQSRQSSVLLFGNLPSGQAPVRVSNAAEQALHELEIYKTPLLPSRLRGSTSVPDMFRQKRRQAPIVLTQDGEESARLGKRKSKNKIKVKDDVANESKPYAGAGGMKKLLARIREGDGTESATTNGHEERNDIHGSPERPKVPSPPPNVTVAQISLFPEDEPFRPGARPPATSSLRVGRAKIRAHAPSVTRPTAPSKSKFSAVYDEDDAMDEDDGIRQKERQELEDAAKKAPVFSIPEGFSFAKDIPAPTPAPSSDAKEPPLTSLPFSFAIPAATRSSAPSPPSERATVAPAPPTPAITFNPPEFTARAEKEPVREESSKREQPKVIPNFFATSAVVVPEMPSVPSTNIFGLPPAPVVTNGDISTPAEKPSLFTPAPSAPMFGSSTGTPFTFGAPPAPAKEPTPEEPKEAPPVPQMVEPPTPVSAVPEPELKPAAEPSRPSLFITPPTPTPAFSFGAPAEASTAVEAPKPSVGFSFGSSAPASAPPIVEAPKPLFGTTTSTPFSFGQPSTPKPAEVPQSEPKPSSPFTFGAPPATPPAPAPKPGFSFGSAATPAAATVPPATSFSFGATARAVTTPVAPKTPFVFGAGPSTPARPATPPRSMGDEMSMDESPVREITNPINTTFSAAKPDDKPGFGGFGFGAPSSAPGGALFSTTTPTSATSPFSFGNSSSNPFGSTTQSKPEEKPGFSFGRTASTGGGFAFSSANTDPARPSTTGSFGFGLTAPASTSNSGFPQQLQPSTSSGAGFSFGQSGSAPSSPQPFSSPSFSFNAPAITTSTSASNPFAFGSSQPASPATSTSGLPQPPAPGGGFSFGASTSNTTPTYSPSTPTSSGGSNLFTIGSAANAPPSTGSRVTRRLPTRRAAPKR